MEQLIDCGIRIVVVLMPSSIFGDEGTTFDVGVDGESCGNDAGWTVGTVALAS
jgi:hypothetical protein